MTQAMLKTVQKYMEELGDSEAEKMTWKYLFTSNLKELSGAVLHKTVFSFRLAYICLLYTSHKKIWRSVDIHIKGTKHTPL